MTPIERDMNSINKTLEDQKHAELAVAIQTKLNYVIDQNKRTRNREKLVKTTTYEILRLMYENDAMQDGRQAAENYKKGYTQKGIEDLTNEAPF